MIRTEAFVLTGKGASKDVFKLQTFTLPALKSDEVLIEVESFGLNYADVMARRGLYRETPPFPCVVGYEVVGKITAVGENGNNNDLGKRVVAFTQFGGYARHAITKINAYAIIDDMEANAALALATQGVTAYYMSSYVAPIYPKETVLIHAAAGGVGTLLIQLAKKRGATVIAKVSSENKRQKCLELGADYAINYKEVDYATEVERLIGKSKLDVTFNPVGGSTFKKDKSLMNVGSKMILFGGSELGEGKLGMLSQINFLKKMGVIIPAFYMMQSKSFIGVNMLKIAINKPHVLQHCLQSVIELYRRKEIHIQNGGDFNYQDMIKAHDLLESGQSIGKIAVHW